MKIRLLLLACAAMALSSITAFAADIDGKWTAEMEGRNGPVTQTFTFKSDGATLTGTVSGRGGETQLSDGKIDGDSIAFTVTREFNGNSMKMNYTGKVSGEAIQFKMSIEGRDRTREFTAKKSTT
ncbi:MAG: hypothetical protein ACRD9L_09725 [Bryobacteraceae bacterium]